LAITDLAQVEHWMHMQVRVSGMAPNRRLRMISF